MKVMDSLVERAGNVKCNGSENFHFLYRGRGGGTKNESS